MKLAVMSDVHSNLKGLQWALQDAKARGVDRIIFLGDYITDGYQDNEVLALVQDYGDIVLSGNRERIFKTFDFDNVPINLEPIAWTYTNLTQTNRKYISQLPSVYQMQCGRYRILMVHGDGFEKYPYLELAFNILIEQYNFDVCFYGHSHDAQNYFYRGRYFINPGSVGIPITQDGYQYKIITLDSQLTISTFNLKTQYDIDEVIQNYKQSQYYLDNPLWASLILRNIVTSEDFGPKFWPCFHEVVSMYPKGSLKDHWNLAFELYHQRYGY